MRLHLSLFLTLVILLHPQVARADKGIFHRVTDAGETYADIADHYYGHRYLERHLRLFNRRPEPLREGTTIIIPTYELVPVKRNQSMSQFASEHLSDPGRAEYLAELHNLRGRDRKLPQPGKRLKVVQSLKHIARRGETLESIANLYYRDVGPRRLRLLMFYNKLPDEGVRSGAGIRIPLDTEDFSRNRVALAARQPLRLRPTIAEAEPPPPPPPPPPRAAAPGKRPDPKRPPPPPRIDPKAQEERTALQLERAERLYSDGEYEACAELAIRALAEGPANEKAKVEFLRLRAFSEVALGDYSASKATFKKLLAVSPKYQLDLYRTSPKILDIFEAVALR